MNNNQLDKYPIALDVTDIQKILGIGKRQAYDLVNANLFRSVRVGKRRIKISKTSFIKWLNGSDNV